MPNFVVYPRNRNEKVWYIQARCWPFYEDKERVELIIGIEGGILPEHWNDQEQRMIRKAPRAAIINARIDRLEKTFREYYDKHLQEHGPPPDISDMRLKLLIADGKDIDYSQPWDYWISRLNHLASQGKVDRKDREHFYEMLHAIENRKDIGGDTPSVMEFITEFTSYRKEMGKVAQRTLTGYEQVKNKLKQYQDAVYSRPITFVDMCDSKFVDSYVYWLNKSGLQSSTVYGKHIKNLRNFMNAAKKQGYLNGFNYDSSYYKVKKVKKIHPYCTLEEAKKIYNLDLYSVGFSEEKAKTMDVVRDRFIAVILGGVDVKEVELIKNDNIENTGNGDVLRIPRGKTKIFAKFPVHPVLRRIIDKHGGAIPKGISEQQQNKYIKSLARLAGVTNNITVYKTLEGNLIPEEAKKYTQFNFKMGRRSFATLAFIMGVPLISIREMMAHSKISITEGYIQNTGISANSISDKNIFFEDWE